MKSERSKTSSVPSTGPPGTTTLTLAVTRVRSRITGQLTGIFLVHFSLVHQSVGCTTLCAARSVHGVFTLGSPRYPRKFLVARFSMILFPLLRFVTNHLYSDSEVESVQDKKCAHL